MSHVASKKKTYGSIWKYMWKKTSCVASGSRGVTARELWRGCQEPRVLLSLGGAATQGQCAAARGRGWLQRAAPSTGDVVEMGKKVLKGERKNTEGKRRQGALWSFTSFSPFVSCFAKQSYENSSASSKKADLQVKTP